MEILLNLRCKNILRKFNFQNLKEIPSSITHINKLQMPERNKKSTK